MKNIRLMTARAQKGISQTELALRVGVARQTVCLIEAGKYNPSIELCIRLCKALGKTLDELFWEEEDDA